jgi:hypothetical protein
VSIRLCNSKEKGEGFLNYSTSIAASMDLQIYINALSSQRAAIWSSGSMESGFQTIEKVNLSVSKNQKKYHDM